MTEKTSYQALLKLYQCDQSISSRHKLIHESIPAEMSQAEEKTQTSKKSLEIQKETVKTLEIKIRDSENELNQLEQKIKKSQAHLMDAKTNEAYQAGQKEIEVAQKQKSQLEDSLLELFNRLEEGQAIYESQEKETQLTLKEHQENISRLKNSLEDFKQKLQGNLTERKQYSTELSTEALAIYKRLTKGSLTFIPITTVKDETICASCLVKIRPQVFQHVLNQEKVETCSSCGRILIHLETETNDE